ncbi:pap2 domain protein [Lasallia pustulata]|uniref:Pap2 domain protein n=1 Tax=Lasallia pustulata TaxID=136370 RepID=A0A1W5D9T2_9LECA|nr:pap2 domain protein [Lasallia pustulata]
MQQSNSYTGRRNGGMMKQQGFMGSVSRFWQRSYAADYVGFAMLLVAYLLMELLMEPFHRMFSLDNIALQYPHADIERVPLKWLFAYAGGIPLLVMILWAIFLRPDIHKVHVSILGLFITLILSSFLTDIVKNSVGRPRPDLIARCKPAKGTSGHSLVAIDVCTETDHHILHDGWRSFPSGHSSFAFSGLGYLALFLAGQLCVFRPRADLARVLLALAPLVGAALIAISRCEDYRHDVYDVTIGSALGIFVAYFSYRRYYPALESQHCDRPYSSPADSGNGLGKIKDEEESIHSAGTFTVDDVDDFEDMPLRESNRDRIRAGASGNT